MNSNIQDQNARLKALNPKQSFIVQAPAGSGKTEILTQRYLVLLAEAEKAPEEIIAITFTRKAAAEMRERVLSALELATTDNQPIEAHRQTTWKLAKNVLTQDQKKKWNIRNNPNRLRILTIDSLCALICGQTPLLSRFGAEPQIIEDATPYYQQAVRNIFTHLDNHPKLKTSIKHLLLHLDNRVQQLEYLLMRILAKREQWLPHLTSYRENPEPLKEQLEQGLKRIAIEKMLSVKENIPDEITETLLACASFAGNYLQENEPQNSVAICSGIQCLPNIDIHEFPKWLGLAKLLLTKEGAWRKSKGIDKRCGFPPKTAEKELMVSLLSKLNENENLRAALEELLLCPPHVYTHQQWQTIQSLIHLLPQLVAELYLIFQENGTTDFIELSLAALRAMGTVDAPTDLALHLDYQIKHLLVDEFQDTSVIQFSLLEKLVSHWQEGDNRSVFLVGDPMQSIYRFRNAEVGLFLRAKDQGLGPIQLEFLNLHLNFRSEQPLVEWTNRVFQTIFPSTPDITTGAVPYSAVTHTKEPRLQDYIPPHPDPLPQRVLWGRGNPPHVNFYPVINENSPNEPETIIAIINQCQTRNPQNTIAILVRSRQHLVDIIPSLQQAGINFQAVEIESLTTRMEIQDIMSLTRALLHRADRISWLAILRAPWCGLLLKDLHILAQHAREKTLWEVLINFNNLADDSKHALSEDAKKRLERVVPILHQAVSNYGRQTFSQSLRDTWINLGGPACLESSTQVANINSYFKLLKQLEQDQNGIQLDILQDRVNKLFAEFQADENARLQIMTIHKSKGLEFDHVILPGLERKVSNDQSEILLWLERPVLSGGSDLLLASMKSATEDQDPIYTYLRRIEKRKLDYETARLLYVAATRSKQSLHLISKIESKKNEDNKNHEIQAVNEKSFLGMLLPFYQSDILQGLKNDCGTNEKSEIISNKTIYLKRLTQDWQLPFGYPHSEQHQESKNTIQSISPKSQFSRLVGTLIHEELQSMTKNHSGRASGPPEFNRDNDNVNHDQNQKQPYWKSRLIQLGLPKTEIMNGINIITQAITLTVNDPRGRWILTNHPESESEYPLSAVMDEEIMHVIIDRCFVDENGVRWIIDYKTSTPSDQNLDDFLNQEKQRYVNQLNQYAQIMRLKDARPIKLGLYFPLCSGWCEWEFTE